jgi:hypothetical protein
VLVTEDGTIVAGHHVTKAAGLLGWTHVAVVRGQFASRDEARDYLIADNQLSTLGHIETVDQMSLLEEVEASGRWEGTGFTADDLADMRALSVHRTQMMAVSDLQEHEANYREHPDDQLEHLTASLMEHGFYRNVVVARDGTVLAGHGIARAAAQIGLKKVPVTKLDIAANSPEALKLIAGDNELQRLGQLNDRQLADLLRGAHDDATLLGTGFDSKTLASLIMVTRPKSEIKDANAAHAWVGLPEFDGGSDPPKLVISFDSEDDRTKLLELIGIETIHKGTHHTLSTWWPERPKEDLSSLRFDFAEGEG